MLISLVLCVCIIFGTSIHTQAATEVDNNNRSVYTENGYIYNILDFLVCVLGDNESSPDGINGAYRIRPPFIIAFVHEAPSFFSTIKSIIWFGTKVRVISYSGNYTYVEVINNNDEEPTKGYIHRYTIDDDRKGELTLSRENDIVYVGKTNSGRLKATYNGNSILTWTVEPEGYIKRDEKTGVITGIKPGIVTVTASAGDFTESCTVSCINEWEEPETATAQRNITVRANPGSTYDSKGTIPKGATITASGDLTDGSGWIYVEGSGVYGFIQLSDFPGIDYLMTEYHYYDKGYELRYNSNGSDIYEYASILNNVMMDLFNLKVCQYVSPYKSSADQCKIWRYGSVKPNNLASSCPKTEKHSSDSCLKRDNFKDDFVKFYKISKTGISNVAWTGHILGSNERSVGTVGFGFIIMTPYSTVREISGYPNQTNAKIREDRIFTLVHETSHQLKLHDHYCREDYNKYTEQCSNTFCVLCYDLPYSDYCIMYDRTNIETTSTNKIYCDYCFNSIKDFLYNNL